MTETEIKDKILDLFNKTRQKPYSNFNESHFLDFLSNPPRPKNSIKNSFKGVKMYYRFMDKLELEFGICFKLSELDNYYSVDSLTKKVAERIQKKRGNLVILKKRNEEKEKYWIELILIAIILITYILLGLHWLSIILTGFFGMAIWWTVRSKIYNRQHIKKLNLIIGKQE